MRLKAILMGGAAVAFAIGLSGGARAADTKEVQMLHWWTSGGEAAALNVIKQALAKQGYTWKDVPVAGGGGGAAMTTLKAMVAAGNPPTASQILGYYALDYADAGKLADITPWRPRGTGPRSFRPPCRSSPPSTASGAPFRSTSIP